MTHPVVSVCVPTYNRAALLRETLKSVLEQDYDSFELLVVDDASSDETREMVQELDDPRIRYVRNDENLGMVRNWNRALSLARGEIIWIVHDDDLLLRHALAHVAAVHRSTNAGLLFGRHCAVSSSLALACSKGRLTVTAWPPGLESIEALLASAYSCVTVSFKRAAYEAVGGFCEHLAYSADEEYWPRIATRFAAARTEAVLVARRLHRGNYMVQTWREPDFLASYRSTYAAVVSHLRAAGADAHLIAETERRVVRTVERMMIPTLLEQGDVITARRYARELFRPSQRSSYAPRRILLHAVSLLPSRLAASVVKGVRMLSRWREARAERDAR